MREVQVHLLLDHPNVVRLHDVYETWNSVSLVTEFCKGGELYAHLAEKTVFSEIEAATAMRQMLRAVAYLHAHQMVHRDLKLENFLYESTAPDAMLKLIDFGFSKVWNKVNPMKSCCGTISYVSPEVLRSQGYTNKCDVWSMGVILFMMLSGYPPFVGEKGEIASKILSGTISWRGPWSQISTRAHHFVKLLLCSNPDRRLSASEALQNPWLNAAAPPLYTAELDPRLQRSLRRYEKATPLQRAAMQLLARELDMKTIQELRKVFLGLDGTNQGTVSLEELKSAIRSVDDGAAVAPSPRPSPRGGKKVQFSLPRASSETISRLFSALDANGDKQVYYSEFIAATMGSPAKFQQQQLFAVFDRLDVDKSGTLSVKDLERSLGTKFEGVAVQALINEGDRRRVGELSFDDFSHVLLAMPSTPSPTKARQSLKGSLLELDGPELCTV